MDIEHKHSEKAIKKLINVTEKIIEAIMQEDLYRKNSDRKSADAVAQKRTALMSDYVRAKNIALNDNTVLVKKSFPFLFEQLKYLNTKLLKLALERVKEDKPSTQQNV